MVKNANRRILALNLMGDVCQTGPTFPQDAPPFFGVQSAQELAQIPDPLFRQNAQEMFYFCRSAQQRAIALSQPGDMVPVETELDPDLIQHILGNCFGIDPLSVVFLPLQDKGKMSLPEAIMADSTTMDRLRTCIKNEEQRWIISPYAVDDGIMQLGEELGTGWGQEWTYSPQQFGVRHNECWRYPQSNSNWSLIEANSKAKNYLLAKDIDPDWVPEGTVASSYEAVARTVVQYLLSGNFQELCVKANINCSGKGNIRFEIEEHSLRVKYVNKDEIFYNVNEPEMLNIVRAKCRDYGLYISDVHPAVIQKWENFFLELTPSLEVYIPPLESGISPFIINECFQFMENGAFVGSISPDPLTVSMKKLAEIPTAFWDSLGISRHDYILYYHAQYLAAWEQQRQYSLTFALEMQKRGEVGHRDFDFGMIVNSDGTMSPKKCESNARRTGIWVADTIGRRIWGNGYVKKGYILDIENIKGNVLAEKFQTIYDLLARKGAIFLPQTQTGTIITGHVRDGASGRMQATILRKTMTQVWENYKLIQKLVKEG